MAKKQLHVWGIEIGQSSLKALRCHMEGDEVVSDAFDFVEYPKLLSQPEADAGSLVADALEQFLSRNDLKNCRVAISVPGQSGLSKFFRPPPVEVKKIPDIVKYEAKQQIPFDLDDVIWDFQQMAGAQIEDGYALESEVGLFAMKRDAVYRALAPFRAASVDVDLIQLSPMSVYNMLAYDRFRSRMEGETFDPDAPPPSTVLLSIGTDSTDLIVTNGFRVWQRSMPIGGSHFTRQLTKDLKLTFAKAEHVKRNAMQADDPKLIFQAMRPVFNDLVTEIQRSLGFFQSQNKKAEIAEVLLLGNTVKLPGLLPFLNKNLGYECKSIDKFEYLAGTDVTGSPTFKENQLAYGVVYGLCLQLLKQGPIATNLIPKEIITERLIRAKKPWAVAALAILMVGFIVNFALIYSSWANLYQEEWKPAEQVAERTKASSDKEFQQDQKLIQQINLLTVIGQEVASNTDRRILWNELLRVIYEALNRSEEVKENGFVPGSVVKYSQRQDFHFTRIDSLFHEDLKTWYTEEIQDEYFLHAETRRNLVGEPLPEDAPPELATRKRADIVTGPGWVVEVDGYHFYNGNKDVEKEIHVQRVLLEFLENGKVSLPDGNGQMVDFSLKELGISHPFIIRDSFLMTNREPNPEYAAALAAEAAKPKTGNSDEARRGRGPQELRDDEGNVIPPDFEAPKYTFTIQFIWQETLLSERLEARAKAREAEETKNGANTSLQASL
jgi:type IV pilus assembly protein PilM